MPKNIPSLKPKELIRILESGGCAFLREGKGDHKLYFRYHEGTKRVVPIDMGANELSPLTFYVFSDSLVSRMVK